MKTTLLFLFVFLSVNLFGQNVYIPDANFKACLVSNSSINTNGDTEIQVSEASAFDGYLYTVNQTNIADLTGIQAFTSITGLNCNTNQLTSLDLSQNTSLTALECAGNQLTSLDLSQNIALENLSCAANNLTSLDVSSNTSLQGLDCPVNQLTSLDLSQNTSLRALNCNVNQLTSLDVSQNTDIVDLLCGYNQLTCLNVANGNNINFYRFGALSNPNLTCIQVDNESYSTDNWSNDFEYFFFDAQTSFSENCNYPSDCFTTSLTELNTTKNLIQILDLMGRETSFEPNTPLIYVYDDGSIEKVFSVEY